MKKKLLIAAMAITMASACAFGFTACKQNSADKWGNSYTYESAYAAAKDLGYDGTLEEFIATISGKDGKDGVDGKDGKDGADGKDGKDGIDGVGIKSAYISDDGDLILVLTDDTEINCGKVADIKKDDNTEDDNGDDDDEQTGENRFGLPLENVNVINSYWYFYDEETKRWITHWGLDLAASVGDNVFAIEDGTVTGLITDHILGENYVTITHKDGVTKSTYKYMTAKEGLKLGDTVKRGDIIGNVAEVTGAETEANEGVHLHFEMKVGGTAVDPAEYLDLPEE